MRENKSNPELKIRSTERDYKYISRITGRYAGLSLVFLTAGIVLWTVMDIILALLQIVGGDKLIIPFC